MEHALLLAQVNFINNKKKLLTQNDTFLRIDKINLKIKKFYFRFF